MVESDGQMLSIGSLFSGIGGLELGLEMTGKFKTVWQVERDEWARRVLRKHWDCPIHDDVVSFPPAEGDWSCDVLCGGFPCQDISYAGRYVRGINGKRSGLFFELMRVVGELGPRYIVLENVNALRTNGLDQVLGSLASLGYDAEWHSISAAGLHSPQRRERMFIMAYPSGIRSEAGVATPKEHVRAEVSAGEPVNESTEGGWEATRRGMEWWATEPSVGRVANGLRDRTHRLRCLGNAVVPHVGMLVGEMLLQIHDQCGGNL